MLNIRGLKPKKAAEAAPENQNMSLVTESMGKLKDKVVSAGERILHRDTLYSVDMKLRMATKKNLGDHAEVLPISKTPGHILGQIDANGRKVIVLPEKSRHNKHVIVQSPSQGGKTFSYVLPNLMQAVRSRESVIVSAANDTAYAQTSEYFRKIGYVVRRLVLNDIEHSDGWDILKSVTRDSSVPPKDMAAITADW